MTTTDLNDYFYLKKPDLDKIINKLEQDRRFDSLFKIAPEFGLPNIKKEYSKEFNILKRCGIAAASSHKNVYPTGTSWYYFRTNWFANAPILLSCNKADSFDSNERIKGFYKKDEYLNEWWGLGDGWQMLRLVKEIDDIKL
jgi:hypothetical protein